MARSVGVVLNGSDFCGYAVFVSLEIDKPIATFVASAAMPGGNFAGMVASASLFA